MRMCLPIGLVRYASVWYTRGCIRTHPFLELWKIYQGTSPRLPQWFLHCCLWLARQKKKYSSSSSYPQL